MPRVGVVNQKGGVGKTTTAINVAAALARRGSKVLLIDCDPQGNATTGLGIAKDQLKFSLFTIISAYADDGNPPVESGIVATAIPGLDILPATLDLAGAESVLMNAVGKETVLREVLDELTSGYDWVILDAPPSLGLLTLNVLTAVEWLLVPIQAEFYALEGLSHLISTVERVRKRLNPQLRIGKVLITMYDGRNRLSQQVADDVAQFFADTLAKTVIPRNVRLSEAPGFGQAAIELYPTSKGALAYEQLVEEMLA